MRLGVMQGRLSPPLVGRIQGFPVSTWRDEFAQVAAAGMEYIEWIYELPGEASNPLSTVSGIAELQRLSRANNVRIPAVCADYFMECPLVRGTADELADRERKLIWLLGQCNRAGVERLVVPCVDHARVRSDREFDELTALLSRVAPVLENLRVEIHLETDLPPNRFLELVVGCSSPWIRMNYDSGNSASLGYDAAEEWSVCGRCIGSVHIKDRLLRGGTVPLGRGDVHFDVLRLAMRRCAYDGDFTLQVARGDSGDELAWARANVRFVREWWSHDD